MVNCDDKDGAQSPRLTVVRRADKADGAAKKTAGLWVLDDVCEYLNMGRTWVRARVADGTLPVVRLGTAVRFRPEEIRAWLERQSKGAR